MRNLPKKSLGQNFITDQNFLKKISKEIPSDKDTTIIEIGPGRGALSRYLLKKKYKFIILIEKDYALAENLKKDFNKNNNIKVLNNDALKINYSELNLTGKVIIVGNLPFNISTKLLFKWLEFKSWPPFYERMILMFQKEVGHRIISKHNRKNYGRISVAAQARCKIKTIANAPAKIFYPIPKVDGIILEFLPIIKYKKINYTKLQLILKEAFTHRRKKIKTNLNNYSYILNKLKIDGNLRPENLSVKDYCDITNYL